jgi:histidinol-phosphatase (PHP family)
MLSDYHLHLRPDGHDALAEQYYTDANVERYRAAADERGIAELGVSEHVYRFEQVLDVWEHPFWVSYAHDDLDDYCSFVREQTDLRLGIEADFVPGAEDRMANLLQARDFDYVIGSVHFIREGAVDMDDYSVWDSGRSVEEIWRRYFQTIGEAARSGLFDVVAHPDLVKMWGPERPRPEGDLRRFYELAIDGGAAQARRRAVPGARVSADVPRSGRARGPVERRAPAGGRRGRLRPGAGAARLARRR